MCGFAGILDGRSATGRDDLVGMVTAMTRTLAHRGPDDESVWVDEVEGVALGHRRLAVIDLSPAGRQPMASSDGRFVIAYNGEIYNAAELRAELQAAGRAFRGHSDTEVLVEGCAAWGAFRCVQRLVGMFAFALWDRKARTMTLARDRLGKKPVYWYRAAGLVLFGSELKALRAHDGWRPEIDRAALAGYLRRRYVAAPRTIYREVQKLPPAHLLELDATGAVRLRQYWNAAALAAEQPSDFGEADATDELERLLRDAVGRRMVADVPLGAFLSGGIDSSTIAALMQVQSARPIRTFAIGFAEATHDEAAHAKAVARHLGTAHTELRVGAQDALAVIPRLTEWFDEPFADSSQIPTYLLAAMTRQHVTVALSGDGGDELFAGYDRYATAERLWRWLGRVPGAWRRLAAGRLEALERAGRRHLAGLVPEGRAEVWAAVLAAPDADGMYGQRFHAQWRQPGAVVRGGELVTPEDSPDALTRIPDFLARMQVTDLLEYLPDDILTKVDRATMAVALEARVPLLDHRVVEFALRLPRQLKVRDGVTKWLLRQVLARYVPRELTERPKMGFGVPLGGWLRGPLRPWAEELLCERRLREEGFLSPAVVRRRWQQHLDGSWDWAGHLWSVLMFQGWLQDCGPRRT